MIKALSFTDVGLAACLIVVNGAISLLLQLDLERKLAWAAVRTVVQLLAVGYVLGWVFHDSHWFIVLPLMVVMTLIAGIAGSNRGSSTYRGQRQDSVVSIWLSSWLIAAVGLFVIIRIHPWYEPQYAIPMLGMVLGNTLTGVALGIERMTEELTSHRDRVEMLLSLGASRWESAREAARQAVRAGMIPTLNQMSVVGVVSLPGMMTGQVLAGQSPLSAVRYQIVVMFMIASGAGLGTVIATLLTYRRLFSRDHRFLSQRIHRRVKADGPRARRQL